MTKHDQEQIYSMQKLPRNTPLEYNVVLLYKQSTGVGSNGRRMYIIKYIVMLSGNIEIK